MKTMYDDLIAELRQYNNDGTEELRRQAADAIEELTGFVHEAERDRDEYRERLDKANDTIEQLTADLERLNDYEAFWKEEAEEALRRFRLVIADKPRWISVEERLPYKSGYYLIVTHLGLTDDAEDWMKDNAVDVTMAHYADYSNIWTTDSGAAYNADLSKCDKTRYEYVTHWMPLPQALKEE